MSQPLILHPKTTEPLQPQSVSDLHQTSNLLHLIHYRNKNQHRRAKWWKDFSTFRREVRRVLELSIPASEEPERKGKGSFQRRREVRDGNVRRREMAMARVGFWKDARLVEGWYTYVVYFCLVKLSERARYMMGVRWQACNVIKDACLLPSWRSSTPATCYKAKLYAQLATRRSLQNRTWIVVFNEILPSVPF